MHLFGILHSPLILNKMASAFCILHSTSFWPDATAPAISSASCRSNHSVIVLNTPRSNPENPPSNSRTAVKIRRLSSSREHSLFAVFTLFNISSNAPERSVIASRNRACSAGGERNAEVAAAAVARKQFNQTPGASEANRVVPRRHYHYHLTHSTNGRDEGLLPPFRRLGKSGMLARVE